MHWREAGLPQGFQILDAEDQQRLVRKLVRSLNLDEARWVPREITWFINAQKDEGLRARQLNDGGDPTRRQLIRLYEGYEESCRRTGVVDFAELLLRSYELWREVPGLADHYRNRFVHPRRRAPGHERDPVRVVKTLAGSTSIPFVVGDDDSRSTAGAVRASRTCSSSARTSSACSSRLEQNYPRPARSSAANAIIANSGRIGKKSDQRRTRLGGPALSRVHRARRSRVRGRTSATGPRRAVNGATTRSCIGRMLNRACSRNTCSRRVFRTASTGA